jgi:hypothetical protein
MGCTHGVSSARIEGLNSLQIVPRKGDILPDYRTYRRRGGFRPPAQLVTKQGTEKDKEVLSRNTHYSTFAGKGVSQRETPTAYHFCQP